MSRTSLNMNENYGCKINVFYSSLRSTNYFMRLASYSSQFSKIFFDERFIAYQILMNASLNHVSMEEHVPITLVATPVLVPGDTEE